MSPVTILSSDLPANVKALSGHAGMHLGSPPQTSHTIALWLFGCRVIAPYSQAAMHQSQPLHFCSSTSIAPVSIDWVRAFSGQALMHGASWHALQVIAVFRVCPTLIARILDLRGLKTLSFSKEQAYSHMSQPTHFSLSQSMCWLVKLRA